MLVYIHSSEALKHAEQTEKQNSPCRCTSNFICKPEMVFRRKRGGKRQPIDLSLWELKIRSYSNCSIYGPMLNT